nr:hypothetical protein [Mycobacterium uberis]
MSNEQCAQIEDSIKPEQLKAVVATSSLDLNIDMGTANSPTRPTPNSTALP